MTNDEDKPGFLRRFIGEFTLMRGSPRELWLIYVTKVLEIVAYGLMSSTLILWLSSDMGFSDAFLEGLSERLEPGSAAVLVLVEHEWAQPLSEALADLEGVAVQQTLTDRLVEQLLEESKAQD